MKFFTYKKDELAAVNQFRNSCVKDRLEIVVSRRAVTALHKIVKSRSQTMSTDTLGVSNAMALSRRGFIRENDQGNWVCTELGLLVLAYGEVGGLLEEKEIKE